MKGNLSNVVVPQKRHLEMTQGIRRKLANDGVHVCRVCGLETPARGESFFYPAHPVCGHYMNTGHPDTEYRPPR